MCEVDFLPEGDSFLCCVDVHGKEFNISWDTGNQIPLIKILINNCEKKDKIKLTEITPCFFSCMVDCIINKFTNEKIKRILDEKFKSQNQETHRMIKYLGMSDLYSEMYPMADFFKHLKQCNHYNQNEVAEAIVSQNKNIIKNTLIFDDGKFKIMDFVFKNHRWYFEVKQSVNSERFLFKQLIADTIDYYSFLITDRQIIEQLKHPEIISYVLSYFFKNISSINIQLFDCNKYLLGFDNGIYDIKSHKFRDGEPKDYISASTGYNFVPKYSDNFNELMEYLQVLQPDPEERDY